MRHFFKEKYVNMWTRNNLKQFKSFIYRNYASSKQTNNVIKYTSTINLPKTDFPQRLSATKRLEVEKKLRQVKFQFHLFIMN